MIEPEREAGARAVYKVIAQLGTPAEVNGIIWRAVEAYRLAAHLPVDVNRRVAELEAQEQSWARQAEHARLALGGYIRQQKQDGATVASEILQANDALMSAPYHAAETEHQWADGTRMNLNDRVAAGYTIGLAAAAIRGGEKK